MSKHGFTLGEPRVNALAWAQAGLVDRHTALAIELTKVGWDG
ncbi:MAG: hypothetical protein ACU0A6_08570 [Shimia sp.]